MQLKTYLIEKGKHYAKGWKFRPFITKQNFTVAFYFDESCKYFGDDQLTEQLNKLFGIGRLNHHSKSDRIAWRYAQEFGLIELVKYSYRLGKEEPIKKHLGYTHLNTWRQITIQTPRYWFGKELNPYFGGKAPAPHNIKIKLKK